jgi:membrane-bound serine protease (ClpP class)
MLPVNLTSRERFFHMLAHPELAYILLSLGTLGLIFELQNPHGVTGVAGSICLVLALISLNILPFNAGGLLLMALGVGLFFADVKLNTHGTLSLLGVLFLLIGSFMLFSPLEPFLRVSRAVIVSMIGLISAFFATVVWLGLNSQRALPAAGMETLVGESGQALTTLKPEGIVHVKGEEWSAVLAPGVSTLPRGSAITVKATKGIKLEVEPASTGEAALVQPRNRNSQRR